MGVSTCHRVPLPSHGFDVIVVGGGVHGIAIARACAKGGKRTLLLEQHDFGSGATSRSPRAVGDVLADLDRGDLSGARETLRERDRLLVECGHLVRPIQGMIALGPERRRSSLEVRFGLWLRRRLECAADTVPCEVQVRELRRVLGDARSWTVLPFRDAICEFPERLAAEWLREAIESGAVVRNYCRVQKVRYSNGEVVGVSAQDVFTGEETEIAGRWIVNATGHWTEHLGLRLSERLRHSMVLVRNVHLVMNEFRGAPGCAVYAEGEDGETVALLPWNGQLLFGLTRACDRPVVEPTVPSESEVEYLVHSFARIFPRVEMHATAAMAGTSAVCVHRGFGAGFLRNRSVVVNHGTDGAKGLLTVFGGALTTCMSAVRDCADAIGFAEPEASRCEFLPGAVNGMQATIRHWSRTVSQITGNSEATARSIAGWHGRRALCVLRMASADVRMRAPICEHTEHLVAEAVNAVRYESAVTLGDILLRRVPVALANTWSARCARKAGQRIGEVLGWSSARIAEEVASIEAERDALLVKVRLPKRVISSPGLMAA